MRAREGTCARECDAGAEASGVGTAAEAEATTRGG